MEIAPRLNFADLEKAEQDQYIFEKLNAQYGMLYGRKEVTKKSLFGVLILQLADELKLDLSRIQEILIDREFHLTMVAMTVEWFQFITIRKGNFKYTAQTLHQQPAEYILWVDGIDEGRELLKMMGLDEQANLERLTQIMGLATILSSNSTDADASEL